MTDFKNIHILNISYDSKNFLGCSRSTFVVDDVSRNNKFSFL